MRFAVFISSMCPTCSPSPVGCSTNVHSYLYSPERNFLSTTFRYFVIINETFSLFLSFLDRLTQILLNKNFYISCKKFPWKEMLANNCTIKKNRDATFPLFNAYFLFKFIFNADTVFTFPYTSRKTILS